MSEEMAQKKREEIEVQEQELREGLKRIEGDICPLCGQKPTSFPYICYLPHPYGWLECAACGMVFAPKSVREAKKQAAEARIQKPNLIVPGA